MDFPRFSTPASYFAIFFLGNCTRGLELMGNLELIMLNGLMIDFDLSHLQIQSLSILIGRTINDHVETMPESQNQNLLYLFLQHLPRG